MEVLSTPKDTAPHSETKADMGHTSAIIFFEEMKLYMPAGVKTTSD